MSIVQKQIMGLHLSILRLQEHIKCIFNEEDFEVAAYEYPSLLEVRSTEIIIKKHVESKPRIVYYDSNKNMIERIRTKWEIVTKEY